LRLWLELNGERVQDSSTADMVFGCAHIVSYVSRFMTLLPGDVICTGTPQGVGMGRGKFLQVGDKLRLAVEGLGEQHQTVRAAR
jgi:ureidoglycolate lyase